SNPITEYQVAVGATETVWARSISGNNCIGYASTTLEVYDNPDLVLNPQTSCEDGQTGSYTFALTDAVMVNEADGGQVTYYATEADAQANSNPITEYQVAVGATETVWARSISGNNCIGYASTTLEVYDNPDIVATNATICEAESIDLASLVSQLDGGTAKYYDDENEAMNNSVNTISSTVSPNATDTYYVVSYNATTGCFSYEPIVITVVPCSEINILKTTQGSTTYTDVWTFSLWEGPDGFGGTNIASETTAAGNITLFDGQTLSIYEEYTVCEENVPAGWSTTWDIGGTIVIPYNPNADDVPPADLGNRCFDIGPGQVYQLPTATYGVDDPAIFNITVDNSFPGGEARTPGYWKNWNTCSGGGQAATAEANGGYDAGYILLDDILNQPGVVWCAGTNSEFGITTCEVAVSILDQRDIATGKKNASDPAYTLAMHALAAQLNFGAGASTCQEAMDALAQAQALLCDIGFDGTGTYLKSKGKNGDPRGSYALELAATLDAYNNNELCDTEGVTQAELITDDSFNELTEPYTIRTYPNPFQDFVTIEFSVEKTSRTTVTLFDISGRQLDILFDEEAVAGHVYEVEFNGALHGDQMFIYRIESDNGLRTGKIVKSE
ncbi:T9SS type A sorting domain-containing protein, partial [Mangrovivirga sp. M17]